MNGGRECLAMLSGKRESAAPRQNQAQFQILNIGTAFAYLQILSGCETLCHFGKNPLMHDFMHRRCISTPELSPRPINHACHPSSAIILATSRSATTYQPPLPLNSTCPIAKKLRLRKKISAYA